MPITTIHLAIYNITHLSGPSSERVITISGEDPKRTKVTITVKNSVTIDLITVQFDEIFLNSLANFIDRSLVTAYLDGVSQTSTLITALKYAGTGGGGPGVDELVKVGAAGTPDYLSSTYFVRDAVNHIRTVERIEDTTTSLTKLWSSDKINTALGLKINTSAIDDLSTGAAKLWSSTKVSSELSTKADAAHSHFTNPIIVFGQQFTGTGAATTFTLTGSVVNGTFTTGTWAVGHVLNLMHSDVTNTNDGPLYDGTNIFTKHRISVSTINGAGLVTLDYAPRNGENFYVWYFYELQDFDVIDDYYRSDFVSSMEETFGNLASQVNVSTTAFAKILGVTDTNVQHALDTLDDHGHDYSDLVNTPLDDSFHSLTAETTISDSDEMLIYDTSVSAYRKMTRANVISTGVLYTNAVPSAITVGGIPAGTTFSGTSFPAFIDLLLYPELFPTLVAPSSTFTISPSGLQEIGSVIATISVSSIFNRGSITPAYGTSGNRSGLPNTYNYTGTGLASEASTGLTNNKTISSYTVLSGTQSWTGSVSYDIGEQPKSSKANNYSSPLAAGTTGVITRSIVGVLPYFATTVDITTMTKQSLAVYGTTVDTSLVLESGLDKQSVEFPVAWGAIASLRQYNTLSGLYDLISLSTFTLTSIVKTINGSPVNYNKYTYNGSLIGARILRWAI